MPRANNRFAPLAIAEKGLYELATCQPLVDPRGLGAKRKELYADCPLGWRQDRRPRRHLPHARSGRAIRSRLGHIIYNRSEARSGRWLVRYSPRRSGHISIRYGRVPPRPYCNGAVLHAATPGTRASATRCRENCFRIVISHAGREVRSTRAGPVGSSGSSIRTICRGCRR
jgi:hypothetical protein